MRVHERIGGYDKPSSLTAFMDAPRPLPSKKEGLCPKTRLHRYKAAHCVDAHSGETLSSRQGVVACGEKKGTPIHRPGA